MATHAEVIANTLASRGVQYVFGLPGGEIVPFIDACRRAGLRFLLTGHEASAAWMAQVVGQMTGVPGVCAATLGPGATNLVTGVANALLDRAPMLAITAQIPNARIGTMTHQRLPLKELFSPVTKRSIAIGDGDTSELIHQSLDLAAAPRPGPVHISLASDVANEECSSGVAKRLPANAASFDAAALDQIAARLQAAERPLLLIGLGATPAMSAAIVALLDNLVCPFLVTPKAKGIISEDDPLFCGVASGMAIDKDIVETIRNADLILAIGFDPVECDKTWFADVPVASIDSVSMAGGDYKPLEAIGDMETMVNSLTARVASEKKWPDDLLESRRAARVRMPAVYAGKLSPLRLIEELREVFPKDGIATCDVGSHKLLMGQFWRAYQPGTFLMSNGLSGMGFGIPAAIGAQLVHPDKAVMAVVGDGGMLMMMHDLTLIRELGLPIILVVLCDNSLSLIRVSAERRGFAPYGVDFTAPNFTGIAKAFGIAGRRAATLAEVKSFINEALTNRTSLLLEVPVDYGEYYDLV